MARLRVLLAAVVLFSAAIANAEEKVYEGYHESYFQFRGSQDDDPIVKMSHPYFDPWYEGTSPSKKGGKICWDGFVVKVKGKVKGTEKQFVPSDYTKWGKSDHAGGLMCTKSDRRCTSMVLNRSSDPGKWTESKEVAPNSKSKRALCVTLPAGEGYHTHIWALQETFDLFNLQDVAEGAELEAYAWVKIEGDAQARMGIDFWSESNSQNDGVRKRVINGHIIQGPTEGWKLLRLR